MVLIPLHVALLSTHFYHEPSQGREHALPIFVISGSCVLPGNRVY